jgi:ferric-chelate reductase [NAD(P)H]
VFSVSILSISTDMKLIGKFGFRSGRDIDKFEDTKYNIGITGAPIIREDTVGYLEIEVEKNMDIGSHTLFVGKIVASENLNDGEPMTYAYYHIVKNGKTPKNAPTYIKRK